MSGRPRFDWPPAWFWLIPVVAAALRMLPVLALAWVPPPEGSAYIGISYLPKDFLSYVAFIRQAFADGSLLFFDPYTTETQSPRFILLYHWLTGVVAHAAGLGAITAFELSRVPLIFALFATLWWFLAPFLPDRHVRVWAVVLAAFGSGFEGWAQLAAPHLPDVLAQPLWENTWYLYGWSLFASLFNPLWIAAFVPALVIVRSLLVSGEPGSRVILSAALFVLLYGIHPYTAIGVGAIVAAAPLAELLAGQSLRWRMHGRNAAALAGGAIAVLALNRWQSGEPVFAASAQNFWGPQALSVFWYPLTLGVTGIFALVGARRGALSPELRPAIYGWLAAVVLLHTSPLINGYKFVFLLHVPLCVLAAPVAARFFGGSFRTGWRARAAAALLALGLFGGAVLQTVDGVRYTLATNLITADEKATLDALAQMPAGYALVPPGLGNIVPAYGPHRVWVGHWFLTPQFDERSEAFDRLIGDPAGRAYLAVLVRQDAIRYLVVPSEHADAIGAHLAAAVAERRPHGSLALFVLR